MATFFGETLPYVSRAVDEDECLSPDIEVSWCGSGEKDEDVTESIIVVTINCSSVLESKDLKTFKLLGEIQQKKDNEEKKNVIGKVYFKKNLLVIKIEGFIQPEATWKIKNIIIRACNMNSDSRCYIFDADSMWNYVNLNSDSSLSYVKYISTNVEYFDESLVLQSPNIVNGLSAALLSHSKLNDIKCSVYLLYKATNDDFDVSTLDKVLTNESVRQVIRFKSNSLCYNMKSSLYI